MTMLDSDEAPPGMQRGSCPPADLCIACERIGYHYELIDLNDGTLRLRWHFDYQGKRFIIYAQSKIEAQVGIALFARNTSAAIDEPPEPQESGYYDYATNTIIDAKDGPSAMEDCRSSY